MPEQSKNTVVTMLETAGNLRSNDIEEFLSNKPGFAVRWGITVFFLILLLILTVCWFIKYPDIVPAKARLSSINAPKEIVTKTYGRLTKILVAADETVAQGQIIGYMESIANPESVVKLSNQLDSISLLIENNRTDEIVKYFPDAISSNSISSLGELQSPYQAFIQTFISFKDFLNNGFFLRKKVMLHKDFINIQRQHSILLTQKAFFKQDISLSTQTFNANENLVNDKIISAFDYRNEKSKLISKKLTLPQINSAIVSNESQQNEKQKEIADLENQITVQKNTFIQALHTMQSNVQA